MPAPSRILPFTPAYRWAVNMAHRSNRGPVDPENAVRPVARLLGISAKNLQEWIKRDEIPEKSADLIATRMGMHPSNIWPEWFELPATGRRPMNARQLERKRAADAAYKNRQRANRNRSAA